MADVNVINQIEKIENTVISGLKDFQKATVTRIDQLYRAGQMRVLVSDEVGLGKTLIARGTIAKLAKLQKEVGDNLVKVVYICSNASIAEQNLNKLRITSELRTERTGSSRLSMQHLNIFKQENDADLLSRYIQLIPLTPDTSFRMTNGAGTYPERALMFAILKRLPELSQYTKALEFAMKDGASSGWDGWAKNWYETEVLECDKLSGGKYLSYMLDKLSEELKEPAEENVTYLDLVVGMCKTIEKYGYKKQNNNYVIGKLRVLFAKISLDKLEPDLVIMDEFQRFKYLINSDPESETGMLANKFFNSDKVRMLLLSATPYKMYSTLEEIDETQVDEHYSEFFDVMDFLNITEKEKNEFKSVWSNYSVHLKELTDGDTTILSAKKAAEDAMYQHICRTERVSATENADIIDDKDVNVPLSVMEQDIKSYLQAQKLLEEVGASFNVPVDYIKSTPYLMSFMRDYQLKRYLEKYFKERPEKINKINKLDNPIKKGGKTIVAIGIFACDAADYLADCSAQRSEDGRTQSLCYRIGRHSGIGGGVLGIKRSVHCDSGPGRGFKCFVAHLPCDCSGIVHLQSDSENRRHGKREKDVGGSFQRQACSGLDYRMGVRKLHGRHGRLRNGSCNSGVYAGSNRT